VTTDVRARLEESLTGRYQLERELVAQVVDRDVWSRNGSGVAAAVM